jgi:hypothetical protein
MNGKKGVDEYGSGRRMAQREGINDQEMDALRIHSAHQDRSMRAVSRKRYSKMATGTNRARESNTGSRNPVAINLGGHGWMDSVILLLERRW